MTPMPVVALASGRNLLLPEPYDIVWSIITLVVIAAPLLYYVLPKLNKILDARTVKIEQGLSDAEEAKEDLAGAKARSEELLKDARFEATKMRDEAVQDSAKIIAGAKTTAQLEADKIAEAAKREISAARQAAEISLRSEIGILATELAEKIVGEHLKDTALTSRVVDRFLDDLESEVSKQEA